MARTSPGGPGDDGGAFPAFARAASRWSELDAKGASDLIAVIDRQARPIFVSPASRQLLGFDPSQLLELPGLSLIHEDDLGLATEALAEVGSGRVVSIDRLRLAHAAGFYVAVEVIGVPLFDAGGEVGSILAIARRPRGSSGRDPAAGDARVREVFDEVPVGLFRSTPDGRILAANPALVRLLGYGERDELLARPALESWADPSQRADFVRRLAEAHEVRNLDVLWRRADGSSFWARLNARAVAGPDGRPAHYEGHVEDVTELKRAEEALRESESSYRRLVEEIPGVLYLAEPGRTGRWLYVSPRIADLLGYTPEEWLADEGLWGRCLHPEDAERVVASEEALRGLVRANRSPAEPFYMDYRMIGRDGREVYVHDEATIVPQPEGEALLRGMLIDVTTQKRAEQALDVATKRATSVIEASLDGIVMMDHRGAIVDFNPAAEEIFGYRRDELIGRLMANHLIPAEYREQHREGLERFLRTREKRVMDRRLEMEAIRRDGTLFPVELTITTVKDADPPVFIGHLRDITERKRAQALLEKRARELERSYQAVETLAKTDPLTGLPNRQALMERLEEILGRNGDSSVAVYLLDVDRFKGINDTLGHDAGDAILVEVGRRLREVAADGDVLARLGGDEFVLVRQRAGDEEAARDLARRISEALGGSFVVGEREIEASASVGIALSSKGSRRPSELLREADAAMYRAKEAGLGRWALFDARTPARAVERQNLLALLRGAGMDQFELHYQPMVDLRTERVCGYEALLRWRHPSRGLVPPGEFLDLAEDTGLILAIGDHVFARACEDAHPLLEPLDAGATVAVNLSARQLRERNLADQLLGHLRRSGLEPHQLCVEITETASLRNADVAVESLRRLRSAGVQVAVDDFGIGYSSLLYLRMFPIDLVKIDRTFVQGMGRHVEDTAIVSAVSHMARSLGLVPVAEGVETPAERDAVRRAGCELAQGYLWGRPVPLAEALAQPR